MTDASNKQVIYSDGIFHGLPDLSGSAKGMTAVVTGANGISGTYMVIPRPLFLSYSLLQ